ncbi:hypothetical protein AAFF_G00004490 [Aldrovandia affinis]|uniref:TRIF N-terminal domain-containing protein n=1 Tax=Aldrovandia affinis TaxID=143900 RepID=A0AAD7X3N6_9TELE|nr:hypothetical protein AAFF_G00004490 [Aldrovandia affinis]
MSEKQREAREEELWKRTESGAGTMLESAFKVLSLAPQERLLSLTFKLGHTQTEELVHAMTLISLGKQVEALGKLQTMGDSGLARHLAEMVEANSSRQEATFGMDRETRSEPQADTFVELARIFRVLAEEKLCDESERDRAYHAALCACTSKTPNQEGGHGDKDQFLKEAREVCGPELSVRGKGTFLHRVGKALKSLSGFSSGLPLENRGLGRGSAPMNIQGSSGDQSEKKNAHSAPSSLRTCLPSYASYPSHLEVSISPTLQFDMRSANRDMQDPRAPSTRVSSNELPEPTLGTHCPEDEVPPNLSIPTESQGTQLLSTLSRREGAPV